jgi:microcystin-dependent protein
MATQPEVSAWESGVYQLETTDPVQGGLGGVSNQPLLQLSSRTRYLFDQLTATNTSISANTSAISAVNTSLNNILGSWHTEIRHTILDGPIDDNGIPTALKIISSAARQVGFDLDVRDLIDTEYIWFSFANGNKNANVLGAQNYIKRIFSDRFVYNLTMPGVNADYLVFAKYNVGTDTVSLDYVNAFASGSYIVQALEPTSAPTARALWFNPFTQKHKLTNNSGATWTDIIAVPIANVTVSGLAVTAVSNYDYRQPFYDFNTPPATVIWQASADIPVGGYLYCNGSAVNRKQYRQLFRKIGTTYGVGDGSTTFNLPDLRGYFLRGFDDGAGVDTGRVFGSTQTDEIAAHDHDLIVFQGGGGAGFTYPNAGSTGTPQTLQTEATAGTETRPKNVAMKAWIKF